MPTKHQQISLTVFAYPTGHHLAGWRHPEADADAGISIAHYRHLAEIAERGLFDAIFLSDGVSVRTTQYGVAAHTSKYYVGQFEPFTLLSALSAVTSRIGLVVSASTTYNEPYHIARKTASLDHLSAGRAAWNVVTSEDDTEAANFGLEANPDHAERYARAEEFVDVVRKLWDSWDDDAFERDKANGRFFEPARLHLAEHRGTRFSVRGPLNVPRSPQGHPVLFQAGSSDRGKALAGRVADAIFTAQTSLSDSKEFYGEIMEISRTFGRPDNAVRILPGLSPVVGRTESEARAKWDYLQSLVPTHAGLAMLSERLSFDLSPFPLDGPLPDNIPETNREKSRQKLLIDWAKRDNLTIRQLYLAITAGRGHRTVVGTPAQIADEIEAWFVERGSHGFNIMPPYSPGGLSDFVELVVPELQRRGIFRTQYEGITLRDHLGLPRPQRQPWSVPLKATA